MTAALEGGECSAARPGRTLPPGKTRYSFYRRLGGPQGQSSPAENLVHTGIRSRTVQHVVSRFTDRATRPTHLSCTFPKHKTRSLLPYDYGGRRVTIKILYRRIDCVCLRKCNECFSRIYPPPGPFMVVSIPCRGGVWETI